MYVTPSLAHSFTLVQEDGQVNIVIEISKPVATTSPTHSSTHSSTHSHTQCMYFKCVADEDLLGLQALELAPPELLQSGDRRGVFGYPFDRDVSDEMKVSE